MEKKNQRKKKGQNLFLASHKICFVISQYFLKNCLEKKNAKKRPDEPKTALPYHDSQIEMEF